VQFRFRIVLDAVAEMDLATSFVSYRDDGWGRGASLTAIAAQSRCRSSRRATEGHPAERIRRPSCPIRPTPLGPSHRNSSGHRGVAMTP
jgi:hypothetical protein